MSLLLVLTACASHGADAIDAPSASDAGVDGVMAADAGVDAGTAVQDLCPTVPTFRAFEASTPFVKHSTGGYGAGFSRLASMYSGEYFLVELDVRAADTTVGRGLVGISYTDIGATRAGKLVTISRSRCDSSEAAEWVSPRPFLGETIYANANSATAAINDPTRAADVHLSTGTWYFTVWLPSGQCPPATPCDVVTQWQWNQ